MSDDDEFEVQRLVAARVFTMVGDEEQLVLRFTGTVETHHFSISSAEFLRLVERFAQDAALLSARPDGRQSPS